MVATSHPTPLTQPRTYSPHTAAAVLGISETTIRNQLRAAPLDANQRRVTDGPWLGAYRRGTHWKVPAAVVRRMVGSKVEASATDLERRLAQAEIEIARCKEAICAAFRALYPDDPTGAAPR